LTVTAALQRYADRGVFRGFSATEVRGGRYEYTFRWLAPRAFTLSYDPARRVLAFKRLFPRIAGRSSIAKDLRALVGERATRRVPAHKRLDARKARASCAVRGGSFALSMTIAGQNEAYVVSQLLNLVNDLFLVLHETYPEYLAAEFGLSAE
jgi:hypothetical protein